MIDCNHAFAVFVGYSIEEIKGRHLSESINLDLPEINTNSDKLLIDQEKEDSCIRKIRNAAGEYKDLIFDRNAYTDENGYVKWIVGTFCDVTELNDARYKAENFNQELQIKVDERTRELELINSKLSCSLANLNQTRDKLVVSEKMASLGSMVAGISHELNTPIGIALTGISSLFEKVNDMKFRHKNKQITNRYFSLYLDEATELSTIILSNIERAVDLITSFKKVSVDQTSETLRLFNVSLYMQDIIKSISNILKNNQVKVNIRCADDIIINSYPGSLYQVITNLIVNSITHGFSEQGEKEKNYTNRLFT